jgi:hydrogenase small subunit
MLAVAFSPVNRSAITAEYQQPVACLLSPIYWRNFMIYVTRREFIKYLAASAVAAGVAQTSLGRLSEALAASSKPPVVWLQGASCSGCSVSLLNSAAPSVDDVLLGTIDMQYHPTLMAAAGDMAVAAATDALNTGFALLVVEGAVPDNPYCSVWETPDGQPVPMREAVQTFAAAADHVVAVGSCGAFGGIPGCSADTGAQSVSSVLPGRTVVNVPGCPAHPDWIIGTITYLLTTGVPPLDSYRRPTMYFNTRIHEVCPLRHTDEANSFGQEHRCLEELGCMGKRTWADCPTRKWHNGTNWCIGASALCVGCTEPFFPQFPFHFNDDDDDHEDDDD